MRPWKRGKSNSNSKMPAVIATLIGLPPSVRFGHHGADRAKFIKVRRQEGGLVIVTGEHSVCYPVPVPAGTVHYVLNLSCRAMTMPGRSVSDVLMLIRSAYGFRRPSGQTKSLV